MPADRAGEIARGGATDLLEVSAVNSDEADSSIALYLPAFPTTAPPPSPALPSFGLTTKALSPITHKLAPSSARSNGGSARTTRPTARAHIRTVWKRYFPPVRLVWIFLGVLVWNGSGLSSRGVAEPLLLLPAVAVAADLGFQAVRFPRIRFPDAAIANGLFLTIILWPTTFTLALASVAVATVGLRHVMRVASHPVLNPAAAGVVIAAALFALPQPWHVGSSLRDVELVAVLGLLLWSKAPHTWRILVPYFVANIALSVGIAEWLGGRAAVPLVLHATVLGGASMFYGFFMVNEPRTAPSSRSAMLVFGAIVGGAAAALPTLFAEYPVIGALGVLSPYLALFVGNLFTSAVPSARGVRRPTERPVPVRRLTVARSSEPDA